MKTNTFKKPAAKKTTLRPIGHDVHKDHLLVEVITPGKGFYFQDDVPVHALMSSIVLRLTRP